MFPGLPVASGAMRCSSSSTCSVIFFMIRLLFGLHDRAHRTLGLASLGKPPVGFLNPLLYQLAPATEAFHDIVEGNNDIEHLGKYKAGPGWDPCTGLGSPNAPTLLTVLTTSNGTGA